MASALTREIFLSIFSVTRTVTRVLVVHRHHVFLLCNSSHAAHNATRSCLISRADFISAWTRFCSASRVALPIGALRSSLTDPAETYSYSPWEIAGTKQNETSLGFSSERFWRVHVARQKPETADRSTARPDALFRVSSAVVITDGIAKPGERWLLPRAHIGFLFDSGQGRAWDLRRFEIFKHSANKV